MNVTPKPNRRGYVHVGGPWAALFGLTQCGRFVETAFVLPPAQAHKATCPFCLEGLAQDSLRMLGANRER